MDSFRKFLFDEKFDRLNNMVRWNGVARIKDETVAHHSFIVSWFTRMLVEEIFSDDKPKLLATSAALFHDFDEMFTGDIIHTAKYNEYNGSDVRKSINEFIKYSVDNEFPKSNGNISSMLNGIMSGEEVPIYIHSIIKLSDWLSMFFYLQKEIKFGNKGVSNQLLYCKEHIYEAINTCNYELKFQQEYKVNLKILENVRESMF